MGGVELATRGVVSSPVRRNATVDAGADYTPLHPRRRRSARRPWGAERRRPSPVRALRAGASSPRVHVVNVVEITNATLATREAKHLAYVVDETLCERVTFGAARAPPLRRLQQARTTIGPDRHIVSTASVRADDIRRRRDIAAARPSPRPLPPTATVAPRARRSRVKRPVNRRVVAAAAPRSLRLRCRGRSRPLPSRPEGAAGRRSRSTTTGGSRDGAAAEPAPIGSPRPIIVAARPGRARSRSAGRLSGDRRGDEGAVVEGRRGWRRRAR